MDWGIPAAPLDTGVSRLTISASTPAVRTLEARVATMALLAAATLLATISVTYADSPGDWPMFHHDLAHTGYNSEETELRPPLRLKWSYQADGALYAPPTVAGGVMYFGTYRGTVYAMDAATGSLLWSRTGLGWVERRGVVTVPQKRGRRCLMPRACVP